MAQPVPSSEDAIAPLNHWNIFRYKLLWAYDNPLTTRRTEWPYIPSPTCAWLLREGSVTLRFASGEEHYEAGEWIFPKDDEAIQVFSSGANLLSLRFQAEWSYGTPILSRKRSIAFPAEEEPTLTRDGERMVRFIQQHCPESTRSDVVLRGDFAFYLKLQPFMAQWISSYYTTLSRRGAERTGLSLLDLRLQKALYIIESHPLSSPLSSRELAAQVSCSVSQLHKLFSQGVGLTPAVLWERRRLIAAKTELAQTADLVKSIAYHLGFSSQEHFSHWFKTRTGLSPREFRARREMSTIVF